MSTVSSYQIPDKLPGRGQASFSRRQIEYRRRYGEHAL